MRWAQPARYCGYRRRSPGCRCRAAERWHQVRHAANEVRLAALEDIGGVVAESHGREQRGVDVLLLGIERARGDHRVVECIPKVRAGLGVDIGQIGQALNVMANLRHLGGIDVVKHRIAVDDRLAELAAQPAERSAAADRVRFSLTGSTFSAIEVTVSNRVLNSVVTLEAVMTSELVRRADTGFFGVDNATYLLPNTVVALMSACTLAGMKAGSAGRHRVSPARCSSRRAHRS